MIANITGDELFSEILMMRNVTSKTFILLEGEADCAAIDPHIEEGDCESMIGYSKSAVLRAIDLVSQNGVEKVVALVDRDWWGYVSDPPENENLVHTDDYDLDATILFSGDVLDRVFAAFSDKDRRRAYLSRFPTSDLKSIFSGFAYPVGALRYLSAKEGHHMSLRDFPIHETFVAECDRVDLAKVVDIAYIRSKGISSISKADLIRKIDEMNGDPRYVQAMCCGHDIAMALSHVLRVIFSSRMSRENIERTVRAAFGQNELRTTSFFLDISKWADKNNAIVWRYGDTIPDVN